MKTTIAFLVAVLAVAALASFATLRWTGAQANPSQDAHEWLHTALQITPAQHAALEPIEAQYAAQNRMHRTQLQEANRELAAAIQQGRPDSPAITAAIKKIHVHMEEMQQASIDHLFNMRAVLTPEQGAKLLQLAEQGLDMSP
jgi:Spy/CpxP family protein refolding chaperone